MTELKMIPNVINLKNWYQPPLWMKSTHINFEYRKVKINGTIYTEFSEEFDKAYEADRLFRILQE